ncbi:MAG: helix-turn-helix domain-containing protein [Halodesulfurarchaeum sp.]|nr:helix-turn-helix domain-containing protein [Halodesulfurarchaeum sp.]
MPVTFDTYDENKGSIDLSEGSNAYAILSFLAEHPDQGFTPREVQTETGLPYGSIGPTLKRLEERDLVRHKEPYWAIGETEHLSTYAAMESTISAIESRYGSENPKDWLDNSESVEKE